MPSHDLSGRRALTPGLAAALALVAAASSPLAATAEPDAVAVKVRPGELQDKASARALAFRLRIAAAKVCGGDDLVVRTGEGFAKCQDAAIQRAVDQSHSAALATAAGLAPPRQLAGADR